MISTTERRIIWGTLALAVLCGTASAQEVGTAAAVNPAATSNLRTIALGSSIAHKAHIQTGAGGSVQLLFVDKTSMTIGPNSDLRIDEYVYDPAGNTGKLAATLGKGALRFVGGQISHNGDAEIKTANAVIGIRGGTAFISQDHVYAGYGVATVNSGGTSVAVRTGEFTQTGGRTNPPTPPGRPPAGFVTGLVQKFQSSGKQTGGTAPGSVSPARVAAAEAKATGSPKRTAMVVTHVDGKGTEHAGTSKQTTSASGSTSHQSPITSKQTTSAAVSISHQSPIPSHHSLMVTSVIHSLHTSSQSAALVKKTPPVIAVKRK